MIAPYQFRAPAIRAEHLAPAVARAVFDAVADPWQRQFFAEQTRRMPRRFHRAIAREFIGASGTDYRSANRALLEAAECFTGARVDLASSDAELCAVAVRIARDMRAHLSDLVALPAEAVEARIAALCRARGVEPPKAKTLRGLVGRVTDEAWWRRALRRHVARTVERGAIRIGMVHRRASIYASSEARARRAEQRRRNARTLANLDAVNVDTGEVVTLADVVERSLANPRVRRAELMTRIAGFEDWALGAGDVGLFITATCPARMHARLSASGDANPKYDGTTPKQAQGYMVQVWARIRAALDRRGLYPYGFRIAEPHHDGTPHWHLLLFVRDDHARALVDTMRKYFAAEDAEELDSDAARDARFKAIAIDRARGSAAGYVAKYVAKNIDGAGGGADFEAAANEDITSTVRAVDAWAATWGIRQFQQVGGPGVTVWRELRRVREARQGDLFEPVRGAADAGNWRRYIELQGGIGIRRAARPFALWKIDPARDNAYGEAAAPKVRGVAHIYAPGFPVLVTREHEWTLEKKRGAARAAGLGSLGPVSITVRARREARAPDYINEGVPDGVRDADGFAIGGFARGSAEGGGGAAATEGRSRQRGIKGAVLVGGTNRNEDRKDRAWQG